MGERPRICLVSASGQNVFFAEILEAFGAALREGGFAVEECVDRFPPPADDLVYLYVPHEYHALVDEQAHPRPGQLRRSVALCTEQPGTPWFELVAGIASQAGAAIDINRLGKRALERRGIPAEHVPLGYTAEWDAWRRKGDSERTTDLAFLGAHTERRALALARCAPALASRSSAIHLVEVRPHVAGSPYFLSHERKWRLLAQSKVLLNVHRGPLAYMEWHRVLGAAINGCVVLSEHSLGIEPFVPGKHFVAAGYDDLPWVLEGLLSDPDRLEAIRYAAYDLVREQMPMAASLDALSRAVERAAANELSSVREAGAPPVPPMPMPPPAEPPEWEKYAASAGDQLPLRVALKQLVVQTRALDRRLAALADENGDGVGEVVEEIGPDAGEPRVSVLLTVHNYADFVGDALRSVAIGELGDIEVIVVDDASTDDSVDAVRAVCAELPWLSVRLVRRRRNGGLPAARNLAVEHARSDLLFVLDADNMALPRGIRLLADALEHDPDAAFAYGVIQTFDVNGPCGLESWLDWDPGRLRHGNYVDAMAMIRRSALDAVGGYSTAEAFAGGWEDFAVWVAMADAGLRGIRVPDFVARYRVSPHSMLSVTNIDSSAAWATLLRKYPSLSRAPA